MHVVLHIHAVAEAVVSSGVVELPLEQGPDREPLREALGQQVLVRLIDELRARTPDDADARLIEFSFEVALHADDGAIQQQWSEHAFFNEAARNDALVPQLLAYVAACADGAWGERIWADCETPAGTHAMNALLMLDRKWIPAYIDFLTSCDLDHEVDQAGDLDLAIETYGWHTDTCALAAARLVSCHGQFGEEQFQVCLNPILVSIWPRAKGARILPRPFSRNSSVIPSRCAVPWHCPRINAGPSSISGCLSWRRHSTRTRSRRCSGKSTAVGSARGIRLSPDQ